jgi:hypothetical protein
MSLAEYGSIRLEKQALHIIHAKEFPVNSLEEIEVVLRTEPCEDSRIPNPDEVEGNRRPTLKVKPLTQHDYVAARAEQAH